MTSACIRGQNLSTLRRGDALPDPSHLRLKVSVLVPLFTSSADIPADPMLLLPVQDALRRLKEELAADPDTESGFYTNTNAANLTKQYVLVRLPATCLLTMYSPNTKRSLPM